MLKTLADVLSLSLCYSVWLLLKLMSTWRHMSEESLKLACPPKLTALHLGWGLTCSLQHNKALCSVQWAPLIRKITNRLAFWHWAANRIKMEGEGLTMTGGGEKIHTDGIMTQRITIIEKKFKKITENKTLWLIFLP